MGLWVVERAAEALRGRDNEAHKMQSLYQLTLYMELLESQFKWENGRR